MLIQRNNTPTLCVFPRPSCFDVNTVIIQVNQVQRIPLYFSARSESGNQSGSEGYQEWRV